MTTQATADQVEHDGHKEIGVLDLMQRQLDLRLGLTPPGTRRQPTCPPGQSSTAVDSLDTIGPNKADSMGVLTQQPRGPANRATGGRHQIFMQWMQPIAQDPFRARIASCDVAHQCTSSAMGRDACWVGSAASTTRPSTTSSARSRISGRGSTTPSSMAVHC